MTAGVRKNFHVILACSVIFGVTIGIYDYTLPFFLTHRGLSFPRIGLIFSISSLALLVLRISAAALSDRSRRKPFYAAALLAASVANLLTPLAANLGLLTFLRSLREAARAVRETLDSVIGYEQLRIRFIEYISRARGGEIAFDGIGNLVAGALLVWLGFNGTFVASGLLLAAGFLLFMLAFKELGKQPGPLESLGWATFSPAGLPWQLKVIALHNFIFTTGLSTSHSFMMPLYFRDKFHVSMQVVAVILALHRLSFGIPTQFAGRFLRGPRLVLFMLSIALQGLAVFAAGLSKGFWTATAWWLLHDMWGAAIWMPVLNELVQTYSRPGFRAEDTAKTLGLGALGLIFGPLIAAACRRVSVSLPFEASGLIAIASSLVLLWLIPRTHHAVPSKEPQRKK